MTGRAITDLRYAFFRAAAGAVGGTLASAGLVVASEQAPLNVQGAMNHAISVSTLTGGDSFQVYGALQIDGSAPAYVAVGPVLSANGVVSFTGLFDLMMIRKIGGTGTTTQVVLRSRW